MRSRSLEERKLRAASFNNQAERYHLARPTYPDALYDTLWEMVGLGASPRIVEVGCGTGQASVALARRGALLTCVEYGDQMAAWARRNLAKFPSATVEVSKFEEWEPNGRSFDLLFASAAWHWIDPEDGHIQAAKLLKPSGSLAIVSSGHVYPEGFDPLYGPIQDVYLEVTGSKMKWPPEPPKFEPDELDGGIDASGLFEPIRAAHFLWHFERTADEYIALLGTYSDNLVRDPEEREQLFAGIHKVIAESPTGKISKHYLTRLRIAKVLP